MPPEAAPFSTLLRGVAELWDGSRVHRGVAVAWRGARITWIGPEAAAPEAEEVVDLDGAIVVPGLVDAHTHAVWAGSRADEFVARLGGASYSEILERGGGIHSTVRATRLATVEELVHTAEARLEGMLARGVTTVEVKSGYGLQLATELRQLRAAAACDVGVEVLPTYLAHVLPPDRPRTAWVDEVVHEHLPAVVGQVHAVDVYCDRGAYTLEEADRILRAAGALGLGLHVHAEQVEHTGVARLAGELGALSADHLERVDAAGVAAMAAGGTVAVLLPGAMLYLRDTPPPVAALRAAGVPLAVATDLNPGSSPVTDLWTCATLACLTMGLTVEEALGGITRQGARALGRADLGWLGPGAAADLAVFRPPPGEPPRVASLVQYLGGHLAEQVYKAGRRVR